MTLHLHYRITYVFPRLECTVPLQGFITGWSHTHQYLVVPQTELLVQEDMGPLLKCQWATLVLCFHTNAPEYCTTVVHHIFVEGTFIIYNYIFTPESSFSVSGCALIGTLIQGYM